MRIAVVGQDQWVETSLSALLRDVDGSEYVGRLDFQGRAGFVPDLVVIGGIGGSGDAGLSERVGDLAAQGCKVLIVAEQLDRAQLRGLGALPGVLLVERRFGPDAVLHLIERIRRGEAIGETRVGGDEAPRLSEQERRVLALTARGLSADDVAADLGIATGTVAAYLRRIRVKYSMVGRPAPRKLDLYHRAVEDGLIAPGAVGKDTGEERRHGADRS
jgi:DNA-binding CsgD family transcriptional regulator